MFKSPSEINGFYLCFQRTIFIFAAIIFELFCENVFSDVPFFCIYFLINKNFKGTMTEHAFQSDSS